ncbi:hypothetical protein MOQ_008317 [Trypanosoma cruzi marinkellei]|uniref:Uncharacterized protein n=1 Tax=Trypanosoma cruzi marinkellei TaxID=85056 RepID=K2MQM1_TRYCR|nr:hypothetical protein MOQ_008317 [Trypanosoma cruzi marinkellei]
MAEDGYDQKGPCQMTVAPFFFFCGCFFPSNRRLLILPPFVCVFLTAGFVTLLIDSLSLSIYPDIFSSLSLGQMKELPLLSGARGCLDGGGSCRPSRGTAGGYRRGSGGDISRGCQISAFQGTIDPFFACKRRGALTPLRRSRRHRHRHTRRRWRRRRWSTVHTTTTNRPGRQTRCRGVPASVQQRGRRHGCRHGRAVRCIQPCVVTTTITPSTTSHAIAATPTSAITATTTASAITATTTASTHHVVQLCWNLLIRSAQEINQVANCLRWISTTYEGVRITSLSGTSSTSCPKRYNVTQSERSTEGRKRREKKTGFSDLAAIREKKYFIRSALAAAS